MSRARSFSKLINKSNYLTHRGTSSVNDLDPETDVATSISSNPIPAFVGMIGAFSMATTTEWKTANRWIVCDGSTISRTVYSDLFTVVGTTWGVGDGSSTFNLPDLRGEFLRGFDDGKGVDSSRVFGSFQDHATREHSHRFGTQTTQEGIDRYIGFLRVWQDYDYPNRSNYGPVHYYDVGSSYVKKFSGAGATSSNPSIDKITTDTISQTNGNPSSTETRPRNVAIQFCIKY